MVGALPRAVWLELALGDIVRLSKKRTESCRVFTVGVAVGVVLPEPGARGAAVV